MADGDTAAQDDTSLATEKVAARPRRRSWLGVSLLGLLALMLVSFFGAVRWLDSDAGHNFLVRRIAAMQPASGLRISVGRIDGQVFRSLTLHDVRFADANGQFAKIQRADLRWYPLGWLSNRLDIDRLYIPTATLERMPRLRSTGKRGSVLPGFDILVDDLRIDRLSLGQAVAGQAATVQALGRADVRSGRAIVHLTAFSPETLDAIRLALDSRPDDRRFDIDAVVAAPAKGLIGGLLGVAEPMALTIQGDGDWHHWTGRLAAVEGSRLAANLKLSAADGRFGVSGPILSFGPLRTLAPLAGNRPIAVEAEFSIAQRILSGTASLDMPTAKLAATGGVDLGRNRFDELRIEALFPQPAGLSAGLAGKALQLKARLAGAFDNAELDYLLTAADLRRGKIALTDLRISGEGRLAGARTSLPVRLTARSFGLGIQPIDERLRNIQATGLIERQGSRLGIAPTTIRASGFAGLLTGEADTSRGSFALDLKGAFDGLELKGLGRLNLATLLRLGRASGGRVALTGTAKANMQRLDVGFLRSLSGGLPVLTSDLALLDGGRVALRNLRLAAPALTLAGHGMVDERGQLSFDGTGRHQSYGPLRLALSGNPGRPLVDVTLASPLPALRLSHVHARLTPAGQGYDLAAEGGSMLGPFKGQGAILLPAGGPARIVLAGLAVGDVTASGDLVPVSGGLQGKLALSGPAEGNIALSVVQGIQHIGLEVDLGGANFAGSPAITVNRGTLRGEIVLNPGAVGITGSAQGQGLRFGTLRIGRFAAAANLVNGSGTATVSANGRNGRLFDLQSRAAIEPGVIAVELRGTVDQRPVRLDRPARFGREDDGWRLAPTVLRVQNGALSLTGLFGGSETHVDAKMQGLPLALLDLANSDLGLGGTADGTLAFSWPRGGVPGGSMNLRVKGLTRSGLALSSVPIDLGINAVLDSQKLAARAVVAKGGTIVGRGQALLTPLSGNTLAQRLYRAPLRAQLRYAGDADTLWRLTNVEIIALGGDLRLNANATGTLADPQIEGSLATDNGRIQSPVTGMALTNVNAHGTFNGSRLSITDLSGKTRNGGSINGSALFDFSAERGIGMDIKVNADRAVVLDRDDVGATVTGPIQISSPGSGGVISGNLDVVASRFMLGRASSVAEIPQLRLIEINRSGEDVERVRASSPWRLDLQARAARGLRVEGLGMQSEWSADLAIGGLVTAPSFKGTADLIRGTYDFAGKRFDLQEGRLTFTGATPVNPLLNIRATADVQDLSATITVTGTSLRPVINFSSIPAMPQDELLSRLLFGTSIAKLSAPEAIQLASAVAAFQGNGGGLDPINAVRRATGLSRLRILSADATTGQKTSIAAGKNIGRNLYVELITDGQGYSATRLEYQITRWLALISSVSTVGRQSISARISKDY